MSYFVTGATGFIGRNLVEQLLDRDGTIYVLVREGSRGRLEELLNRWGAEEGRIVPVIGDLSQEKLGCEEVIDELRGEIDHFFHLAAIYDMTADAESQRVANVEGTREAVRLAEELDAKRFHMVSSIAAAGLYKGTFTEEMFDEAENVENHPYFQTKHESEAVVREECSVPWRVYRPGIVVGNSETGEMDKIDGPYYFFKLLQRARNALPQWFPGVGIEGRKINIVPVDYVARAMDHIAHIDGFDGQAFHLTDPKPLSAGQVINVFAKAAHAPEATMRIDSKMFDFIPKQVRNGLTMLPPVKRITDQVLADFGIPRSVLVYINYPTDFDSTKTQTALEGTGISVPPLASYADRLWDYWERNLDPDLFKDRSLSGAIGGKVVMITGASSGIGRATAIKCGEAGAEVLLVARTPEKLEETKVEIEEAGGTAHLHQCDLSRHRGRRADGEGGSRPARAGRHPGQQRGPLHQALSGALLRPVPRLRADDAAQLLRRPEADPQPPARHAEAQQGAQGRPHHQRQLDRRSDPYAPLLRLCGLQGSPRRLVALRRLRGAG